MRGLAALAIWAACTSAPLKPPAPVSAIGPLGADTDAERRARLIAELQDVVLASYAREDPPDIETEMVDPVVGPARIGVGPGDVLFGRDVELRASSRWPLFVLPSTPTTARSKRLDIHLSADRGVSAAWISDEISWRITVCGRTAAIPLRMTALYAHDGDRWVEVVEHLSFGHTPTPTDPLIGLPFAPVVVQRNDNDRRRLADELSGVLQALLSRSLSRIAEVVALDPDHLAEDDPTKYAPTFLLAPDADGEWHGDADLSRAVMTDGDVRAEDRRVGTVGPSVTRSTVAYWVGNFTADLPAAGPRPAGKVRLRGTFVFEKRCSSGKPCERPDKWVVVQGHVSQPVYDIELATDVFGTALVSDKPLQITCDDGRRSVVENVTVPTAAP